VWLALVSLALDPIAVAAEAERVDGSASAVCVVTADNPEWVDPVTVSPVSNLTFVNLFVQFGVNKLGNDRVRHRSYNGAPVGPVIRTRPGAELVINLENKLPSDPIDIDPPGRSHPSQGERGSPAHTGERARD